MTSSNINHILKEFLPLQLGETKKIFLKNGSSISTKWQKNNEYIFRYKSGNRSDYYSPYFLYQLENGAIKRIIPYPNKRSFGITLLSLIIFVFFKKIKPELYITLFGFSIVFTFLLQFVVGIAAYHKIKTNVFEKNKTE